MNVEILHLYILSPDEIVSIMSTEAFVGKWIPHLEACPRCTHALTQAVETIRTVPTSFPLLEHARNIIEEWTRIDRFETPNQSLEVLIHQTQSMFLEQEVDHSNARIPEAMLMLLDLIQVTGKCPSVNQLVPKYDIGRRYWLTFILDDHRMCLDKRINCLRSLCNKYMLDERIVIDDEDKESLLYLISRRLLLNNGNGTVRFASIFKLALVLAFWCTEQANVTRSNSWLVSIEKWLGIRDRFLSETVLCVMLHMVLCNSPKYAKQALVSLLDAHSALDPRAQHYWKLVLRTAPSCDTLDPSTWSCRDAARIPRWYGLALLKARSEKWIRRIEKWPIEQSWQLEDGFDSEVVDWACWRSAVIGYS